MSSTSEPAKGHLIFIDNLDSFTYNLVDELAQFDFTLDVWRNTVPVSRVMERIAEKSAQGPVAVCLSPGPGHPRDAGNMMALIRSLLTDTHTQVPVLGICLGFQALIEHYGGQVSRCDETVHGKTSQIDTISHPVFDSLISPLSVARYHSLMAVEVPEQCNIIASYQHIPMAFCQPTDRVIGYQFHPESIMTIHGRTLLRNTMDYLFDRNSSSNVQETL